MLKKSLILVIALLLVISSLSGCGEQSRQSSLSQESIQNPKDNILKMAVLFNPPKLDPVFTTDTASSRIVFQIFENLVDYDENGNVQPLLAESWDISQDKTGYIFHLRKGVKFHKNVGGQPTANGGREVKADDWVWSFNYILSPEVNSPRAYLLDMIKGYHDYQEGKTDKIAGITKLDDYTLKIELEYPFAPFLNILAFNAFSVLPKEDIEKYGTEEFNFHPVGTGPFKFEKWIQDDRIVLSKNEDYWKTDSAGNKLPYLDGIEFRVIPDPTMQWSEFKLGNFDQIEKVSDAYYAEAKELQGFIEGPTLGTYYYCFNLSKEPFKDNKALRQALNYAIDRQGLIDMILNGRATPATGILPPGMMGYDKSIEPTYDYDVEKAKALLKEAGYPNGIEIEFVYYNDEEQEKIAQALQAQLKQVGISLTLRSLDPGALLDAADKMELPFFGLGWVADYPDPDTFLYPLLHSSNIGPGGNYSAFDNAEFDDLIEKARVETDPVKRAELYKEAEALAREEAPMLFIYHYTSHILTQPYVKNVVLPFLGEYSMKYTEVKLDR